MPGTTEMLIANRFEGGATIIDDLIAPLAEIATDSASLIIGYVPTASRRREDALPYFHVCGSSADRPPVRVLVVGGWFGNEERSPYAIARLIAALEQKPDLAAGFEVTAFPVANLEAHRSRTFLTRGQSLTASRCWEETAPEYVRLLERELQRYDYDLVIFVREHPRMHETDIEAWLTEDADKHTLGRALTEHAAQQPGLRLRVNPSTPDYRRTFTPVPGERRQPAEILVGLSATKSAGEQTQDFASIVFALLAARRTPAA